MNEHSQYNFFKNNIFFNKCSVRKRGKKYENNIYCFYFYIHFVPLIQLILLFYYGYTQYPLLYDIFHFFRTY